MTPALTAEEFGKALITSGDLDPIYIVLAKAGLDKKVLDKVLLAYWLHYDLGVAVNLAHSKTYWSALTYAALNEGLRWPRGTERRHYRGKFAVDVALLLASSYRTPSEAVTGLAGKPVPTAASEIMRMVKSHYGFGNWIAFKVADMRSCVLGYPTAFNLNDIAIYQEPRKGAALIYYGLEGRPLSAEELAQSFSLMKSSLKGVKAPPLYDKPVDLQEVETVFCKYKSYAHGKYYVGKDCDELRHSLGRAEQAATSKEASKVLTELLRLVPKAGKGAHA